MEYGPIQLVHACISYYICCLLVPSIEPQVEHLHPTFSLEGFSLKAYQAASSASILAIYAMHASMLSHHNMSNPNN